jgi:anti-anti-sigma factor
MSNHEPSRVIAFEGQLDIESASQMKVALLQAFAAAHDVTVDLAKVESMNTAALQVLLAARQHAASHGLTLRYAPLPSSVVEAALALGLSVPTLTGEAESAHAA